MFEYRRHAFPQFIVEHINTVNNNLEVSQYFFTDIIKEGILLYDSGKCQLAKPRKLSFREIRDIAQNEFSELYPYACGFLEGVKGFYLPKDENKISAFLLHQSCEKLYNTILMVFTNYRPKSHRLQDLGGMVKRFSMELVTVFLKIRMAKKSVLIYYAEPILKPAITKITKSQASSWNILLRVLKF